MGLSPSATIETWSIFAIDFMAPGDAENTTWFAQQMDTVAGLLNEIIKKYKASGTHEGNSVRNLFNYSRSVMFDFGGDNYCMIDLLNWARTIKRMDGNFFPDQLLTKCLYKDLSTWIQKLEHDIHNDDRAASFISKNETKSFYNMSEGRYISPQPYGYSLFFPRKLSFDKNPRLAHFMKSDQLLNEKLPEWLKFIKEMCGLPSDTSTPTDEIKEIAVITPETPEIIAKGVIASDTILDAGNDNNLKDIAHGVDDGDALN